ncbi:hypothetical protein [Streptomyces sp. V3I7]|nr:hypothetical protein [Streptomyces sp. V3I7]MDQ0994740.1 hypothetical protein [Streptomyces sp. V3I7]
MPPDSALITHRRTLRAAEEYCTLTAAEREDFLAHAAGQLE